MTKTIALESFKRRLPLHIVYERLNINAHAELTIKEKLKFSY
jgi:hypothetical protein